MKKIAFLFALLAFMLYGFDVRASELSKAAFNMVAPASVVATQKQTSKTVVTTSQAQPRYELVTVCDPRTRTCRQEWHLVTPTFNVAYPVSYFNNATCTTGR